MSPWVTVVALGVTQIISWGTLYYAFALMVPALAATTGAGQSTVVGAFSVALLAAGLASAPVGRLIDRRGGRLVMSAGSLVGGIALISLAHVVAVWQLYLVWALLGVAMAATLYDPAFTVLGQLFEGRQRKAITAVTLFGGFASTVFWPLTQVLIDAHSWQQALHILGGLSLAICLPLHLMLPGSSKRPPVARGASPGGLDAALRDPAFYRLCFSFTGNALVFTAMSVHLIPLLQLKGLTPSQATWIGALVGPTQVAGRLFEYAFLSRWSATQLGKLAMWLLPLSLLVLAVPSGAISLAVLFALLYGAGNGLMTIVRGAVPLELYGAANYGAVNGAMATPVLLAKAVGPIAAAMVLTAASGPTLMLTMLLALSLTSAGLFALTSRSRRPAAAVQPP